MFFMMGISDRRKNLDFNQTIICTICGRYGGFRVFMSYTVLSLFFIPVLKWNKHYYVQTSCCHTLYELDEIIGKRIERGEDIEISPENLTLIIEKGYKRENKKCSNCGYETNEDFDFCPKCGTRF